MYLIRCHRKAYDEFIQGMIFEAMKTLYDYESMRQKPKFEAAVISITKHRQSMGLPI
jgi:hypothetical protein